MTQAELLTARPATAPTIRLHPGDDVAVALSALEPGQRAGAGAGVVEIRQPIPRGHKVALRPLARGETVRKFGWPIGRMRDAAEAGEHIHVHNLETLLEGVEGYRFEPLEPEPLPADHGARFLGYRRGDGRAGTRNEIWILPTVGCVARTAQRIAAIAHARHAGAVDGVYAFQHPHGCSQLGDDLAGTRSLLAAMACHPNASGVLLVGLGCESN